MEDWAAKRRKIDEQFLKDVSTDTSLFSNPKDRDERIKQLKSIISTEFMSLGLVAKTDLDEREQLKNKLMSDVRYRDIGYNDSAVFDELLEETVGFGVMDRIRRNPDVTDVTFNGTELVIETNNEKKVNETNGLVDADYIERLVKGFATASDGSSKDFNESNPIIDIVVGNMRLNAVHGSSAQAGITMAIRLSHPRLVVTTEVIGKMAPPYVGELLKAFVKAQCNTVIAGKTGTGKALPNDALIPTPLGWIKNGNLAVGDPVFAGDGSWTIVKGVYPQGRKRAYRVKFKDGREEICNDEHLWAVLTNDGGTEKFTLREIMRQMNKGRIFCIPIAPAVRFAEESFEGDPFSNEFAYYLGSHINEDTMDKRAGDVLFMDETIRYSFIQGVFDAYSNVDVEYGIEVRAYFKSHAAATLSTNVMRSLGFVVNLVPTGSGAFILKILDDSRANEEFVNKIKREFFKLDHRLPVSPAMEGLLITEVEDLGTSLEMTCIEVDHPDHTYLSSNFLVTHNTEVTKYLVSEIPFREKITLIEDVAEMHAKQLFPKLDIHSWVVTGSAKASDLLKASLRNNPEWVIVTELRSGEEAVEWLEAIKSDHRSLTSLHASSTSDIPSRIAGMYAEERPVDEVRFEQTIFKLLNIGVQIEAKIINGKKVRFISEVMEFRQTAIGGPILLFKQHMNHEGVSRYAIQDMSEDMRQRLEDVGAEISQFDKALKAYYNSDEYKAAYKREMNRKANEHKDEVIAAKVGEQRAKSELRQLTAPSESNSRPS